MFKKFSVIFAAVLVVSGCSGSVGGDSGGSDPISNPEPVSVEMETFSSDLGSTVSMPVGSSEDIDVAIFGAQSTSWSIGEDSGDLCEFSMSVFPKYYKASTGGDVSYTAEDRQEFVDTVSPLLNADISSAKGIQPYSGENTDGRTLNGHWQTVENDDYWLFLMANRYDNYPRSGCPTEEMVKSFKLSSKGLHSAE